MSCGAFSRGAHSMFSKPTIRKVCQRKCSSSSSPDSLLERSKVDAEEVKKCRSNYGDNNEWIPDERTGIFYPKGQEKVMEGIPQTAAKDIGVNWFSFAHNEDACV